MKILIISLPRTGSTSLLTNLGKEKGLEIIFEPWDGSERSTYKSNMINCCLKTMIFQSPETNYLDYHKKISKEFDEVILLSRRDLSECAESWAYLKHHNHKNFNSTQHYVWKTPPNIEYHKNDIYKWNNELTQLSEFLNIGITYYEDIFDKNSNERYRKNLVVDKNKLI